MFNLDKSAIMQLIYMSTPSESMSEENLVSVVRRAQQYNIEHEISGFLISDNKNVVQLLEGSKKEVMSLFDKIKKDSRHHNIKVQYQKPSDSRAMPFFGMGLCFINSVANLTDDFYYSRMQAREFSGLVDGEVGSCFRRYLF